MRIQLYKYYRKIDLYTEVDDEDYQRFSGYEWHVNKRGYVVRYEKKNNYRMIILHREIFGLGSSDCRIVDHKNHNKLDNRRSNLRICTNKENVRNRLKQRRSSNRYKGVYKSWSNFMSRIWIHGGSRYLGTFKTEEDAARAYDQAAKELYGEFACLNFPDV